MGVYEIEGLRALDEIVKGYAEDKFTEKFLGYITRKAYGMEKEEQKRFAYTTITIAETLLDIGDLIIKNTGKGNLEGFLEKINPEANLTEDLGMTEEYRAEFYESVCHIIGYIDGELADKETVAECIEFAFKNSKPCQSPEQSCSQT